jgi:hypothetical protein
MPKCEHCGKPLAFSLDATFVEACSVQSIDYPKITLVPIYRAGLNRAREGDHKFVKKRVLDQFVISDYYFMEVGGHEPS